MGISQQDVENAASIVCIDYTKDVGKWKDWDYVQLT